MIARKSFCSTALFILVASIISWPFASVRAEDSAGDYMVEMPSDQIGIMVDNNFVLADNIDRTYDAGSTNPTMSQFGTADYMVEMPSSQIGMMTPDNTFALVPSYDTTYDAGIMTSSSLSNNIQSLPPVTGTDPYEIDQNQASNGLMNTQALNNFYSNYETTATANTEQAASLKTELNSLKPAVDSYISAVENAKNYKSTADQELANREITPGLYNDKMQAYSSMVAGLDNDRAVVDQYNAKVNEYNKIASSQESSNKQLAEVKYSVGYNEIVKATEGPTIYGYSKLSDRDSNNLYVKTPGGETQTISGDSVGSIQKVGEGRYYTDPVKPAVAGNEHMVVNNPNTETAALINLKTGEVIRDAAYTSQEAPNTEAPKYVRNEKYDGIDASIAMNNPDFWVENKVSNSDLKTEISNPAVYKVEEAGDAGVTVALMDGRLKDPGPTKNSDDGHNSLVEQGKTYLGSSNNGIGATQVLDAINSGEIILKDQDGKPIKVNPTSESTNLQVSPETHKPTPIGNNVIQTM